MGERRQSQAEGHQADGDVRRATDQERRVHADARDEHEAAYRRPGGRAERVQGVEDPDGPRHLALARDELPAEQRKRPAHQDRRGQEDTADQEAAERREQREAPVDGAVQRAVDGVERRERPRRRHGREPHAHLEQGVRSHGTRDARREPPEHVAADGQPAEEHGEHRAERERGRADRQGRLPDPADLVGQGEVARGDEAQRGDRARRVPERRAPGRRPRELARAWRGSLGHPGRGSHGDPSRPRRRSRCVIVP